MLSGKREQPGAADDDVFSSTRPRYPILVVWSGGTVCGKYGWAAAVAVLPPVSRARLRFFLAYVSGGRDELLAKAA
jgi:hypothetical protein